VNILTYKYDALDAAGAEVRGTLRAEHEQEAYRKLASQGLTPIHIAEVEQRRASFSWQRVNSADIVDLTRELAVLVESRIPLDRGLASIAENDEKPELTAMVRDIAAMIESGQPFTAALEKYRERFGDVYIETVRAAEKSGNLVDVMNHLADLLERQSETRKQVRRAMMYPAIVMTVVAAALTVILVFVVPKFAATFASQGAQLPLATRIIQAIGESMQLYWWAYLGGLVGTIVTLMASWKNPQGRVVIENALLRVPYVKNVIIAVTAGRFARVFGIGLSSGLDVIESLDIGGKSTGRPVFIAECNAMAARIRQGETLPQVLSQSKYLPSFARRMICAGKDSTELAKACNIVARHYDREATDLTKNVNTVIEPLMTVAMAGIVLVVALAVFLPMWGMVRLHH
jgi:type II secretory pathway component PulF